MCKNIIATIRISSSALRISSSAQYNLYGIKKLTRLSWLKALRKPKFLGKKQL